MKVWVDKKAKNARHRADVVGSPENVRGKRLDPNSITAEVDIKVHNHNKVQKNAGKKPSILSIPPSPISKKANRASIANNLDSKLGRPWDVFMHSSQNNETNVLTHVSLFSGCGGIDLGFHHAGFKTIFANDINPDACLTYRGNIGEIFDEDIRTVKIPKFRRQPDILTAGFPCQPFSNAGSRKGVEDDRGTLYQTALNIVGDLKPRCVIFENVRGLLSFKAGKTLLIQGICEQLDKLGYNVTFGLVDASQHNVPQKRLRVFIVGVEKSKSMGRFSFPQPIEREDLSLRHTILDLNSSFRNQDELMQLNPQALHIGSMVPEGGSWKDIPYKKLPDRLKKISDNIERYRWPKFYRRFHRDEIAGTITAAFKPENAGVWHPTEKRIFSVREIARIQTFPDWFSFEGRTIKSKYQQIGNAVPPRLAYEMALQIKAVLRGKDLRGEVNSLTFDQFIRSGKPLRVRDRGVVFSEDQIGLKTKRIWI
jgi:DNA (cytosine-5)-methyltransferase 1